MRFPTWTAAVCGAAAFVAAADSMPRGVVFELHDQFGRLHVVRFPRTRVGVLVLADRRGSEQIEGWIGPIYARYRGAVVIEGVARLQGVPEVLRGWIRAMFRRHVPDHPVLLDWSGEVFDRYGGRPGVANVMVLRPDGAIEHRYDGAATPEALEACFRRIDRLLGSPGAD